ncbi:hypothetical protein D3C72_2059170 [compost metagenome]
MAGTATGMALTMRAARPPPRRAPWYSAQASGNASTVLMAQADSATTRLLTKALRNELSSHRSWYHWPVMPLGRSVFVQLPPTLPTSSNAMGSSRYRP